MGKGLWLLLIGIILNNAHADLVIVSDEQFNSKKETEKRLDSVLIYRDSDKLNSLDILKKIKKPTDNIGINMTNGSIINNQDIIFDSSDEIINSKINSRLPINFNKEVKYGLIDRGGNSNNSSNSNSSNSSINANNNNNILIIKNNKEIKSTTADTANINTNKIKQLNNSVSIQIEPILPKNKIQRKQKETLKKDEVLLLPTDLNDKVKRLMTELDPNIYGYWVDTKEHNKKLAKQIAEERKNKQKEEQAEKERKDLNIKKEENIERYKNAKQYINDFFGDGEIDGTASLNEDEKMRVSNYLNKLKQEAVKNTKNTKTANKKYNTTNNSNSTDNTNNSKMINKTKTSNKKLNSHTIITNKTINKTSNKNIITNKLITNTTTTNNSTISTTNKNSVATNKTTNNTTTTTTTTNNNNKTTTNNNNLIDNSNKNKTKSKNKKH